LAHLGKDSYSHIHYDSRQARTISVREAARLQSFPDGFVFAGSMNPALKQIGNAVPALFAYAIAMSVRTSLGAPKVADIRVDLLGLNQKLVSTTSGNA
jgi:DNA (cytosine-5)-methyltransferase 1